MEVKTDENPEVVYETMRQILAARAIHNIFRMTESHLLVTCDCLKWVALHFKMLSPDRSMNGKQRHIVEQSQGATLPVRSMMEEL